MIDNSSFSAMVDSLNQLPITQKIQDAMLKCYDKVHGLPLSDGEIYQPYKTIMVSISGGSDSDIVLDMIERCGHPAADVRYVFFDTGMEYQATKDHLDYLERRYGVTIERYKAKVPVPLGCKKYGVPFLSKRVSDFIHRLQINEFQWEDEQFDVLYKKYPRCKGALQWWCNAYPPNGPLNISRNRLLKEFMISNPLDFPISDGCCYGAKKYTKNSLHKKINSDMEVTGVRKWEGGVRSIRLQTCFDDHGACAQFRPAFWLTEDDKKTYESVFGVRHSACYSNYGLKRTGCACCPFGREFEKELATIKIHEPGLYKAAMSVFGKSYEYTRRYRAFVQKMDAKEKRQEVFA